MASSSKGEVASSDPQRRLDSKDLPVLRRLGRGLSGFIYETTWSGSRCTRKDFPLGSLQHKLSAFEKESKRLFNLDHPNITKCFGYTVGKRCCSLLQEYVDDNLQNAIQRSIEARSLSNPDGTYHSRLLDVDEIKRLLDTSKLKEREITGVLGSTSTIPPSSQSYELRQPLDLREAAWAMLQIATGMKYLHDNRVVHGDLKPKNVLFSGKPIRPWLPEWEEKGAESGLAFPVSDRGTVKVADFGLVETKKGLKLDSKRSRHLEILTWKAPERLEELLGPLTEDSDDPFTDSDTDLEESEEKTDGSDDFLKSRLAMADVYSFGLTCAHIMGGKLMFPNLSLTQLRKQRRNGFNLELPSSCPAAVRTLIYSCTQFEPLSRPTFTYIRSLTALLFVLSRWRQDKLMEEETEDLMALTTLRLDQLSLKELFREIGEFSAMSTSTADHIESLPIMSSDVNALSLISDEVLRQHVFAKLPLFDLLRARAVCRRWQGVAAQTFDSQEIGSKSYCPLLFKRDSDNKQHLWWGYDCAARSWEPLPPLTNLTQVDIKPLAGNGKRLMGFRITRELSQVVVGNPLTSEWQTIPKSAETWGDVGNFLVVDSSDDSASTFQIIAVREDATEIYHSKMEVWNKLRQRPPPRLQETTVLSMRDKLISGTLSGGLLFCYGGGALVSFDVAAKRWTEDHIRLPPHTSSKCFQMLECGGNLFVAIEDATNNTISIWGLGLRRREFSPTVQMPPQLYSVLCRKKKPGSKQTQAQLKAVGHKHRMYFWRNSSCNIVSFNSLRREWAELPQFDPCLGDATGDQSGIQTFVDTGSFEP